MSRWLAALAAALPLGALAQEAAPQLQEDPRAPRFREVERGIFVGFEAGYLAFTKTPTRDTVRFPNAGTGGGYAGGFAVSIHAGVDVTSRLALSAFGLAGNLKASTAYGAFDVVSAGGDLRFALVGSRDTNGAERLFVYVHGRVGYVWSYPDGLFASTDLLLGGGVGAEYFTRLRHFSVGAAVDGVYLKDTGAPGFAVVPTLRYTF